MVNKHPKRLKKPVSYIIPVCLSVNIMRMYLYHQSLVCIECIEYLFCTSHDPFRSPLLLSHSVVIDIVYFLANCLRRKEADRQRSLDIERWLKSRFRQAFNDMKYSFQSYDKEKTGQVRQSNTGLCVWGTERSI